MLFQDLIPGSPLATINENLRNSFGYNAEIGWENTLEDRVKYNLTLFRTFIGNRIGNFLIEENGQTLVSKSNIGNSLTDGIEIYLDWKIASLKNFSLSLYTSTSIMNARYLKGQVSDGASNRDITGNKVEAVPMWISRNGATASFKNLKIVLQHQFVDETFADAFNTHVAPATAAVGLVPAYHLWDLNLALPFLGRFALRAGINNIFDKQYFTKRPQMYPGPGIWPSDGRCFVVSMGAKF